MGGELVAAAAESPVLVEQLGPLDVLHRQVCGDLGAALRDDGAATGALRLLLGEAGPLCGERGTCGGGPDELLARVGVRVRQVATAHGGCEGRVDFVEPGTNLLEGELGPGELPLGGTLLRTPLRAGRFQLVRLSAGLVGALALDADQAAQAQPERERGGVAVLAGLGVALLLLRQLSGQGDDLVCGCVTLAERSDGLPRRDQLGAPAVHIPGTDECRGGGAEAEPGGPQHQLVRHRHQPVALAVVVLLAPLVGVELSVQHLVPLLVVLGRGRQPGGELDDLLTDLCRARPHLLRGSAFAGQRLELADHRGAEVQSKDVLGLGGQDVGNIAQVACDLVRLARINRQVDQEVD
ncbi:MAG TPA: hypothetical protein VF661_05960, partial [Actinomycetales bacterium]